MAMQRAKTRNIVVVMSGIPLESTEWDLSCAYRDRGVSDIGSHYVVLANGDVLKGRPHEEHGNCFPRYNKDSVFIEVMGCEQSEITDPQAQAIRGAVALMEGQYPDAEELDITH